MKRFKELSRMKKIMIVATAVVLVAAIICGCLLYAERSRYACQYAKPFRVSTSAAKQVTLVSHRGLATEAPENTLPAYEKAAEKGFQYVETDIHATADGVWVLSHDANLKRMTGYDGVIEQMQYAEVTRHPIIKGANAAAYEDLYTPSYEQFLALCREKGLIPVIEVKTAPKDYPNAPYRTILTLLQQYGLAEKAILISFEYDVLALAREYGSDIAQLYLVKELDKDAVLKVQKLGNCGIDCECEALLKNQAFATFIADAQIPIGAWTVDDNGTLSKLIALGGVRYITTNAAMPGD